MTKKSGIIVIIMTLMSIILLLSGSDQAREDKASPVPEGVYLELTKDFYEQLGCQGQDGGKVYSNDFSQEYLKEIAVSARFVVETNLQILKQQERIIHLLQDMLDKQK